LAVVTGLGDLFSSFTVGWLWAAFGSQVAFSTAAALMVAGILLMLHLSMKQGSAKRPLNPRLLR
jgi:dipeptide/tripeptide permease